jgi:hypothetical protein
MNQDAALLSIPYKKKMSWVDWNFAKMRGERHSSALVFTSEAVLRQKREARKTEELRESMRVVMRRNGGIAWPFLSRAYYRKAMVDASQADEWYRSHDALTLGDLYLGCDDVTLQLWCERRVSECRHLLKLLKGLIAGLGACFRVLERYKMEPPIVFSPVNGPSVDLQPLARRFVCERWWRRQARKMQARAVDRYMRARGDVAKYRQVYCSDWGVKNRDKAAARNAGYLSQMKAVNDLGQEYNLADLAALGNGDLGNRRNELMVRMRGFEEVARDRGHVAEFWTFTAPSMYHRMRWIKQAYKAVENHSWNGADPRQVQEYLQGVWSRIRADLARADIRCYGFRVVEPHHDGTPHWHLFLMFRSDEVERAREIARDHLLRVAPDEPGAKVSRFVAKAGDPSKGGAAAYMAKYVAKNIDGRGCRGELSEQDDDSGLDLGSAALRVRSWASIWGIRQFQQIGGPAVTVWRELRRLWADHEPSEGELLGSSVAEEAGQAADAGDWAAFVEVMGGPSLPRSDRPILPTYWIEDDGNCRIDQDTGEELPCYAETLYGDPVKGKVFGVSVQGFGEILTRLYRWTIERIKSVSPERDWRRRVDSVGSFLGLDAVGFCGPPARLGLV